MNLEIALAVLVVILILLLIGCIPLLVQIWRILKDAKVALETLNQSLPSIMKNIEETTANANRSTATLNQKIQSISSTLERSQFLVGNIMGIAPVLMRLNLFQRIKTFISAAKGISIFMKVLLSDEKGEKDTTHVPKNE